MKEEEIIPAPSLRLRYMLVFFLIFFLIASIVTGSVLYLSSKASAKKIEQRNVIFATALAPTKTPSFAFPPITLEGKAAIVYDLSTKKILFAKNADMQLPLASLTKLMTAYVANTSLHTTSPITITPESLMNEGDSGLYEGEVWNFKDLLSFTMMQSSNDGASAIAAAAGAALNKSAFSENGNSEDVDEDRSAFIKKMNQTSQELGLTKTYFTNETGLDSSVNESGSYGSAHDIALLLGYLHKDTIPALEDTEALSNTYTSLTGQTHLAKNTNQRVGNIPGLMISKTGYTDLAGGNLAILFDAGINHPIAVVVLGSSVEGRFTDAETLVKITLNALSGRSVEQPQN